MIKNLLLKKFIPLFIYSFAYVYYMIFNWKVFVVSLNVNLGFGVVSVPPSIIFFLLGFVLIGILSWMNYISSLRKIIYELQHGVEAGKTKDRMLRGKLKEHLENEKNLELLEKRLGIPEIRKQFEEIRKELDELKRKDQD